MEAISYLTGISVILIMGILLTILSSKLKTSNILMFVLAGIFIGNTPLKDLPIFNFPATFLVSIAILTLAIIVFDGSSRFDLRELDALSARALETVLLFMLFNVILITVVVNIFYYGFTAHGVLFGIVLAIILAGTDPGSVFILLGDKPHKVLQFLKVEALINTPIMVLFPFLLIDLISTETSAFFTFVDFIGPFLLQIIVGIGTGVLIGAIVFKAMRKWYSESLSPVAVISAALLSYIMSENLGGNGVLAVAVLGLLFGNTYVKQKGTLQEFSNITAYSLQILVFIIIGIFIKLPTDPWFWYASFAVLGSVLISRFCALHITNQEYKLREKIFMTLNLPKGIAVAVVAFTLLLLNLEGFEPILNLMIIIMVYTLIISSITDRFGKYFLRFEIQAPEKKKK